MLGVEAVVDDFRLPSQPLPGNSEENSKILGQESR